MALPSFLRRMFSVVPAPSPGSGDEAGSRIQEQINPTFIASSPTQEDWYWGRLATGKSALKTIVRLKHLCYYETSSMILPRIRSKHREAQTNHLGRFVMSMQHSDSPHKSCKICSRTLPATTEYFHRDKNSKDGLCSSCKECKKASRRAYYTRNTEKAKAYSKQYVADNREHTAEYQKLYAEQHQAELTEYKKAYYVEHQEEQKERNRAYYAEHKQQASDYGKRRRLENPEQKREQYRKYRQEHIKEKREKDRKYKEAHRTELAGQSKQYYVEHREERLTYLKQYYQTERGIVAKRAGSHNRRARKKKAPGSHTTEQLYQQFMKQDGKCFYCQVELQHSRNSWNADHVIPLSRGGSNGIENLVIACPSCNRRKHAKLPHEWLNGGEI